MAYEVEHSFASFIPKEGLADCIANEDGERQIACAVSFHGEEIVCIPILYSRSTQNLIRHNYSTSETKRSLSLLRTLKIRS